MISTLRSFAVQTRILSKECNIIADGYVRSTAQDDVKFARHPELGATHVDTCVNIDKRLRNKCAIVCVGKNIFFLGRESKRSSETSYACEREGNNFFNKVYSLLTSH